MIEGSCHCGSILWRTETKPEHLAKCTCSFCRRSGALWGEVDPGETEISGLENANEYITGDRMLAFLFCRNCGILSHWASRPEHGDRMKLNFRLADPELIKSFKVRTFDGAKSWQYLD